MAFEYLFEKLEHSKAQDSKFPLKKELKCMLDEFGSQILNSNISSEEISEQIKELRRRITHGYSYYYDFDNDYDIRYIMHLLDKLIKCMSLKWIGFSKDEIRGYKPL